MSSQQIQNQSNNTNPYDPRLQANRFVSSGAMADGSVLNAPADINPTTAFFSMLNKAIETSHHSKTGPCVRTAITGPEKGTRSKAEPRTESATKTGAKPVNTDKKGVSRERNANSRNVDSRDVEETAPDEVLEQEATQPESAEPMICFAPMPVLSGEPALPGAEVSQAQEASASHQAPQDITMLAEATSGMPVLKEVPVQQAIITNELSVEQPEKVLDTPLSPLALAMSQMEASKEAPVEGHPLAKVSGMIDSEPQFQMLQNTTGQPLPVLAQTAETHPAAEAMAGKLAEHVAANPLSQTVPVTPVAAHQQQVMEMQKAGQPDNVFIDQLMVQGDQLSLNLPQGEMANASGDGGGASAALKAGEAALSRVAAATPQNVQVSVNLGQTSTGAGSGQSSTPFGESPIFSDEDGVSALNGLDGAARGTEAFSLSAAGTTGVGLGGQAERVKVAGATATDQVVNATKMAVNNGQKEITLQLSPDQMGQVKINLVSTANGQVHARFVTSNAETQQELQGRIDQLKAALEKQGVQVGQILVVTPGEASTGNQAQNQNNGSQQGNLFRQPESTMGQDPSNDSAQHQGGQQAQHTSNGVSAGGSLSGMTGTQAEQSVEAGASSTARPDAGVNTATESGRVSVLI